MSLYAQSTEPLVSVVIIGRNEGVRLQRCIESVQRSAAGGYRLEVLYVDSASTDGSRERASGLGVRVLRVDADRPCAAIGRNAGWRAARGEFVMFLDGDTVLDRDFIRRALSEFDDARAGVVWGHRRELDPRQSIYVRVLDLDWVYAPGPTEFCGGDALVRRCALEGTGGFDETVIAGEEPELCRRIRALGFEIRHIDVPMTLHDLAITGFRQYWMRAFRAGHAYAEMASRFGHSADPLWLAESRRNFTRGGAIVLGVPVLIATWLASGLAGAALMLAAAMLVARTVRRCRWKTSSVATRIAYAIHSHFQQLPILFGQLAFLRDYKRGRARPLIEYKEGA